MAEHELLLAAQAGDLERTRALCQQGTDASAAAEGGVTPLLLAAQGGYTEVVHLLCDAKAELQKATSDGATPLLVACQYGHLDVARCLLDRGADKERPKANGATPLYMAAMKGHLELVQWLLREGANVRQKDNFGLTAYMEASQKGHEKVASLLQSDGADFEALVLSSGAGLWAIPANEVRLEQVISRTLKSTIYSARWRGTKVVAKSTGLLLGGLELGDLPRLASKPFLADDSEQRSAAHEMLHEIHLLSTLRHPDLVMFLGACLEHKPPFFLTEYMEGGDLDMFYRTKSKPGCPYRPPWATFVKWLSSVARALCYLHNCSRPIIHRDLKPMNLLLNSAQDLKVADFGISKLMTPKAAGDGTDTNAAPRMSGGVGTWRYMAPEVVRYLPYTDRVDIFSFALIMWFMYTGLDPFVKQFGEDAALVLEEYVAGREPRPDALESGAKCGPALPKDLHELLQDCWHEIPERRPSAEECTERLASLLATEAPGGRFALVNRSSCLGGKARAVV
mmetsp:Transcript_56979/g.172381  ORF Transcript_56979/g.172381 Transcript_56979/m.172381 type:complete len:509 (+) Transcript_56979:80-1606(+)